MKQDLCTISEAAPSPPSVTVLQFKNVLAIDPDPLGDIYATYGEDAAEDTVCRTLADIGTRLLELDRAYRAGEHDKLPMITRRIAAVSGQIGLIELSIAASHVATAMKQRDHVAVAATLGRVERCYSLAMTEVWSF